MSLLSGRSRPGQHAQFLGATAIRGVPHPSGLWKTGRTEAFSKKGFAMSDIEPEQFEPTAPAAPSPPDGEQAEADAPVPQNIGERETSEKAGDIAAARSA